MLEMERRDEEKLMKYGFIYSLGEAHNGRGWEVSSLCVLIFLQSSVEPFLNLVCLVILVHICSKCSE